MVTLCLISIYVENFYCVHLIIPLDLTCDNTKKYFFQTKRSKTTSTGVRLRDDEIEKKKLPCFSFCPWPAFKRSGFYFNNNLLRENTYAIEDFFTNETLSDISNSSKYLVREVKSYLIGRCFTVCHLEEIKLERGILLQLKKLWDIMVYIHPK